MAKFTEGPWQVMNEYDGATIVIANVDGETFPDGTSTFSYDFVCDTDSDEGTAHSKAEARANARLIAQAPAMLAELEKLDGHLSILMGNIHGSAKLDHRWEGMEDVVRGWREGIEEVMAAATGEAP